MTDIAMTWLIPPLLLLGAFIASGVVAAALSFLVMAGGPVDRPRDRGAHSRPTPTSGGLAVMAGTGAIIAVLVALFGHDIPGSWRDGAVLFGFASVMGLSGALDDLLDLPPRWRLGFQVAVCLAFAWFYRANVLDFGPGMIIRLPAIAAWIGSAAWLVLGINTINFMDGSNGLATGVQSIALMAFALLIVLMAPLSPVGAYLGVILMVCVCAAGAQLGFMPFNMLLGKAFQGDAGALFAGALITGTTLIVKAYGIGSVWFGGFLLAPLLVDVVLTLVTRARHGKNLMKPHNEHLYQLWLQRRDPSHARLALRVWGLCMASSLVGLGARIIDRLYHSDIRFLCLVMVILIYSLMWANIRRSVLKSAPVKISPAGIAVASAEAP